MTARLKAELVPLEGMIHAFMAKDMLKLIKEGLKAEGKAMEEECKQEVSTTMKNEIQKSKEAIAAVEAIVAKVQENVEKKVYTWVELTKDAVDKEVKECTPWIEEHLLKPRNSLSAWLVRTQQPIDHHQSHFPPPSGPLASHVGTCILRFKEKGRRDRIREMG
ncbi:hypothetical protein L7F22_027893 [Adiantum nelumboides]|nr:hypothetical protein [Adiantum nelumboides]